MSPHVRENVVNLSVWRDDICVGTVRLRPDEVPALVAGLAEGLAELSRRPVDEPARVRELERRLARVEARLAGPSVRSTVTRAVRAMRGALDARRVGGVRPSP